MRHALTIAAALLLTGCASKREICAQWSAAGLSFRNVVDNGMEYRKKLGIKTPIGDDWTAARDSVTRFCKFYKN